MSIFERYAPFVQDYIYRNEWENLRAVQVAAGDAIFNTDENVLISASTAAGKTEAAFFPIITLFSEDMPSSVGCIYIGPLKALINDQFERLNELCDEADIPVWHWHGDVAMSHKHKLIKNPSGILQITPESLEAMLMRKSSVLSKLFGDLRFIVIDAVHSLLRGDRGGQTLCLIERLCRAAGVNPRRIGLSATIGEPETVGRFLAEGTGRGTTIPTIEAKGAKWRVSVEHFYIKSGKDGESSADKEAGTEQEAGIEDAFEPSYRYIFDTTKGRKCLIFSNSREESEVVTSTLRRYSELLNEPERFQIHHGNISAALRETAEMIMTDDDMMQSTVTTATLELGIDIGKLERAFQIDAPWTVSSFLQRMGRTGRRNLPPEMWSVIREDEVEERAMLPVNIPWKLLQAIALIQLYVEEKWVEPPRLDRLPFSLLYHQTMTTLMSCGELTPGELARRVLTLKYFHRISLDDFKVMLQYLVKNDHIEKTAEGGLIVGPQGEKIVNSFKFYGVFKESEEYSVRNEYEELGTIVAPPPVGEKIAIAGRVWTVLMVAHKRHSVYCTKVKGDVPAYFGECPGDLHTKVLQRMRRVLCERRSYPYLKKNALSRLAKAIDMFKDKDVMKEMLFNLGGAKWCFMPWVGTYSFMTLERIIRLKCAKKLGISNFASSKPFFMVFNMRAGREEFYRILKEETQNDFDMLELIFPKELPLFEKYDEYLPPELTKKGFAEGVLDKKEIIHLFD